MLDVTSPFLPPGRLPQPEQQTELAARRLRQALVECHLQPGSYVSEEWISQRYALGRASVRVALTTLSNSGFVVRQPRQGWRIAPITPGLVHGVLEGQRLLEPVLAARLLTAGEIGRLDRLTGTVAALAARSDRNALVTARVASRQIKDELAVGLPQPIGRWLSEVWDHAARIVARLDQDSIHITPPDQRSLVEALSRADERMAERCIASEYERFRDLVMRGIANADLARDESKARSARRRRTYHPRSSGATSSTSAFKE